jgi:Fe-S cluster assembly protein SufD
MTTPTVVRRRTAGAIREDRALPFSEEDVRRLPAAAHEPAWMLEHRLLAWRTGLGMPMPGPQDEAWRRTDLRGLRLNDLALRPADSTPVDPELIQPLAGQAHGALLVLRPGSAPDRRIETPLPSGVVFCDWGTAARDHGDLLRAYQASLVAPAESKFAAISQALATDGVFVYVPSGVQVELPLHSVLWAPGSGTAFFSRLLIVVDRGASLTYVHEAASPSVSQAQALHAGIVELLVAEDARLTFVELQNWGEHVYNLTHERSRVERQGKLDWVFGAVGSRLTKNFSELTLAGAGAEGRMSGFYFAGGNQHLDHDTQQNHLAPHTTSDLLFKGALVERSRSVWQGMIYVAPGAQKTDGYQANRNLILSKEARADSIPGLEILADDVRCSHGATVGQLEDEPVFYLMSRGLPRPEAERLVIDGFFSPIMERIPFEGVRERFRRMIDGKLKVGGSRRQKTG